MSVYCKIKLLCMSENLYNKIFGKKRLLVIFKSIHRGMAYLMMVHPYDGTLTTAI